MIPKINNLEDLLKGHINGSILDTALSRLTAPGENYGSLMLKVDIKVKNGEKQETIYAVAKCVPPNKQMQAIFNIPITFRNEVKWYATVIPTMLKFIKEKKSKIETDFFMAVYGARLSLNPKSDVIDDDAIILCENLKVKGYENVDRRAGFDLKQSKETLKKLATFHAINLALKLQKPEIFNQNVKQYLHVTVQDDDKKDIFQPVINFLKGHQETSSLVPRVIKALEVLPPNNSSEVREPWGTAIHTDFWGNNIMIKQKPDSNPEIIILDLQSCSYGSPVDDLLFFLGSSVQTNLAEKHFDELIKFYYNELMANLKLLDADTTLFPYGSFQRELELQAPVQFFHCMFFVGIIQAEKSDSVDTISHDFNPEAALKEMFENLTDRHKDKYVLLVKEYAKRNWI